MSYLWTGSLLLLWCWEEISVGCCSDRRSQLPQAHEWDNCRLVWLEESGHRLWQVPAGFGSRCRINNNNDNDIAHFPLQLHWHMGSINRISLLLRRKPGMLSLWTWAILDTKHQCVPLIRANSRWEETAANMSNTSNRPIRCLTPLALSSHLPDTVHCFWPRTGRKRLWWGSGKTFLWGIWQQVQAWRQVKAKGLGSALPGVWKAEKANERQLIRPATQYRVLHERHWCLWKNEQVKQHVLVSVVPLPPHSAMTTVFFCSKFSGIRGQFEDMCADLLARVEPPLQSLLENTSKWHSGLSFCLAYKTGYKLILCSIRTEKGRHICSGDSGWCFQDPSCQRENQQILWEGAEHHTECWWSCSPWMRSAGTSQVVPCYFDI